MASDYRSHNYRIVRLFVMTFWTIRSVTPRHFQVSQENFLEAFIHGTQKPSLKILENKFRKECIAWKKLRVWLLLYGRDYNQLVIKLTGFQEIIMKKVSIAWTKRDWVCLKHCKRNLSNLQILTTKQAGKILKYFLMPYREVPKVLVQNKWGSWRWSQVK